VVLVKFRAGQESQAPALFTALTALKAKLPGMQAYHHGSNSSPEGLNQGFTHGFVMSFADAAARDHYLDHPDHEAVKAKYLPLVENVLVFDFEG
jgi:hypothetical protein